MSAHPVRFRHALAVLACGLALPGLVAPALAVDELPRSPACRTALDALDSAEATLAAAAASVAASADVQRQRAAAARLQPLRLRVANACLGGLTTSPPPSQHTRVVPAPARLAAPAPRQPAPGLPSTALPMPRFEAPLTVGTCTAAVCIASDGSTLTRVGPTLIGPRGACTQQGAFLRCP